MPAKVEEDFGGSVAPFVEELKTERFVRVEMAGFGERKNRSQLPAPDVHIKRLRAHVEKTVFVGEHAELTTYFDHRGAVGKYHMNSAQRFKGMDDFLPTRKIEFVGGVTFQGAQDFHFGNSRSVRQQESHLSTIVIEVA